MRQRTEGEEIRGGILTTRVVRIPPYGAGDSRETSPSPSFGAWQKQAGGEKGSERDLNSGGKTRVEKGAFFTDLARGAISSDGT